MSQRRKSGMTLVEVLVSLLVVGLIISSVTTALYGGFFMIKEAEYKSRAIGIATAKMQEALTGTYESVKSDSGPWVFPDETKNPVTFAWEVTVDDKLMPSPPLPGKVSVPYKDITVNCTYAQKRISNLSASGNQTVSLKNIIPYPLIHSNYVRIKEPVDNPRQITTSGINVLDKPLSLSYEVPKDVSVYYYVAVMPHKDDFKKSFDDKTDDKDKPFLNTDTVIARCFNQGKPASPIMPAPVLSQPFQSNSFVIENVRSVSLNLNLDLNLTDIKEPDWRATIPHHPVVPRNRNGRVYLREAEIIVVAIENATAVAK